MRRLLIAPLLVCFAAGAAHAGDDKVFSGPQPGEKLTPFKAVGVYGDRAGKEFEVTPPAKDGPALLVFVHEITRPAFQFLRPVDAYAAKHRADGLATQIVWLHADRTEAEAFLNRAKGSLNLQSPVCISLDGAEGPGNYGLNRKVTLTVLVAKGNQVVANFAIVQPNETDAPKVLAALAKVLGKEAPAVEPGKRPERPDQPKRPERPAADGFERLTAELQRLQKQVNDLTAALNEAREKIAKLEGKPAPPPLGGATRPDAKRPDGKQPEGRPSQDPELQKLMRQMIQKDNDEAAVKRIADAMTRWAGEDRARREELREYCRLVIGLRYGTEAAQAALKKLAGE